jgi:hypothetical protein
MSTYGDILDTRQLEDFLQFFFENNLANEQASGERPTPLCIWGMHGLGKTASVVSFARARGWRLAYCAPAQFEEIGDIHGLPMKIDPDPTKIGDEYTAYLPPEWVPRDEGPGILLLDDVNRADDRILRGLMQLLQNFEMFSWALPKKWQIVCTANPEDGDYSVTPMDDAMLTRMLHVSLKFDVKAWAAWATEAGVDARGIDFILTYPEVVTGKRTTPRSLVQVFSQLQRIPDLKANLGRVSTLLHGGLDATTASAFLSYVNDGLEHLVDAVEILEARSFAEIRQRIVAAAVGKGGTVRLDRLSAICTRLVLALASKAYENPSPINKKNVIALLTMNEIPGDLRFSMHRDISALPGKRSAVVQDPELAKLVLKSV